MAKTKTILYLIMFIVLSSFSFAYVVSESDALAVFDNVAPSQNQPTFDTTRFMYYFRDEAVANLEDYGYSAIQFPHWRINGTNVSCHVHWLPSNTNRGNVTWEFNYTFTGIGQVLPASKVLTVSQKPDEIAFKHQIAYFPEIDGTGKNWSSIIVAKVTRKSSDPSDTFAGNAYLSYVDCHYKYIDGLETTEENNMYLSVIFGLIAVIIYFIYLGKDLMAKPMGNSDQKEAQKWLTTETVGLFLYMLASWLVLALFFVLYLITVGTTLENFFLTLFKIFLWVIPLANVGYWTFYIIFLIMNSMKRAIKLRR